MNIEQLAKEKYFEDVPRQTLESVMETYSLIQSFLTKAPADTRKELLFLPEHLTFLSDKDNAPTTATAKVLSDAQLGNFRAFVRAAQDLATANACGSVLAGQSSEGDEYADAGLMLVLGRSAGEAMERATGVLEKAKVVLAALSLEQVLLSAVPDSDPASLVSELELASSTGLPTSFECEPTEPQLGRFKEAQAKLGLATPFAFAVDCSALQSSVVLHVLLGRVQHGDTASSADSACWIGLLGVGIWS